MIILLFGLSLVYYRSFIQAEVSLAERLSGRILLQVEEHGEAWYLNPLSKSRHYLGRPEDAFALMRSFGLGISENDIKKIPLADFVASGPDSDQDGLPDAMEIALTCDPVQKDSDNDGYNDKDELLNAYDPTSPNRLVYDEKLRNRLSGFIIIQAEKNGEAWYVSPENRQRYYLGRPADALAVMRQTGLGISNSNLARIDTFQKLAESDESPEQISRNNGKKSYQDNEHAYRFSFPDTWTMSKISGKTETVFLRNYRDDVVKEGAAVITVSYLKNIDRSQALSRFKTESLVGGKKLKTSEDKINGHEALFESFEFSKSASRQTNAYIRLDDNTLLLLNLFSAGKHEQHEQIFNETLKSLEKTNR
jgi:hypothetical protein